MKKVVNCILHHAALDGQHEIAKLLIAHGADSNVTSSHGNTALVYALIHQQEPMARILPEAHGVVVH